MGANTGKQDAQLQLQNQMQQQQQNKQNSILDQNNSALSPYLDGNHGFTAQQTAALNSSVLDQNALRYGQAAQQTNQQLAARGESGASPMSGVGATGYGNLQAASAGDLASGLRTNVLNNAQQGLANQFNAASVLSGNAQTLAGNVGTYGSGAANALNNVTQAQSQGLGRTFVGALGSGLGSGISSGLTGGLGTGLSKLGSGNLGF